MRKTDLTLSLWYPYIINGLWLYVLMSNTKTTRTKTKKASKETGNTL